LSTQQPGYIFPIDIDPVLAALIVAKVTFHAAAKVGRGKDGCIDFRDLGGAETAKESFFEGNDHDVIPSAFLVQYV
jgi:hypothetical protein